MQESIPQTPVLDLNFAAYQYLHGNTPELELQGTRIIFMFIPNEEFSRVSESYNRNSPVNVLDFVSAQRQLRAMMMAAKGSHR